MTQPFKEQGTEPQGIPATSADQASVKEPQSKGPLWSDVSDSKRVQASIWRHEQKGGKARYTICICRRYKSEREGKWISSPFFDRQDLDDILIFAQEAKRKLERMTGEPSPD